MKHFGLGLTSIVRVGSLLNPFYDWMGLPYFNLPDTGVSLLVGQEVTIYGDSLINVPIDNNLNVIYACDIGSQVGNNYVIDPTASDVGEHTISMLFKNNNLTFFSKTININIYPQADTSSKNILIVGDSTTGADYICPKLISVLNNTSFTFLGTQGTTYKNEGYGGWTWNHFITEGSPFFKNGVVDIASYFSDNSIDIPDIVYIRLGINDLFSSCSVYGDGLTETEITTIINNAKTLIDAFLAYDANLKIVLGVPTLTENTGDGWNNNYDESFYIQNLFLQNIHKYRVVFINEFANAVYDSRVDCSYEAILLDRDEGYPKTDGLHTNGVHPDQSGYEQLGVGIASYINKNRFGAELIDQDLWATADYWNHKFDSNWNAADGVIYSNGSNGFMNRNALTENKKYAITWDIERVAGTFYGPYNGTSFSGSSNVSEAKTVHGTWGTGINRIYNYSVGFNGIVKKISMIEEFE